MSVEKGAGVLLLWPEAKGESREGGGNDTWHHCLTVSREGYRPVTLLNNALPIDVLLVRRFSRLDNA